MNSLFKYVLTFLIFGFHLSALSQFNWYSNKVNFETSPSNLEISTSAGNTWQIGNPSKTLFNSGFNSPKAIVTNLTSAPGVTVSEFTYWIDSLGATSIINFDQRLDLDPLTDTARIFAKFYYADSSIVILPLYWSLTEIYNPYYYANSNDIPCKGLATSTSSSWGRGSVALVFLIPARIADSTYPCSPFQFSDIINHINNYEKVSLVFQFKRTGPSTHEGWIIDNLSVYSDISGNAEDKKESETPFSIQPNPASDFLTVQGQPQLLEIRDGYGNKILSTENSINSPLDIQSFPSGIYFVYFKTNDKYTVQKLVVTR
ncbi:MAG: T9SS type A sorting domain-containing protein [Cytophagales bacterium]|nr:T9SS type A sorting domain-containing protein [Cytophagales bacterium]